MDIQIEELKEQVEAIGKAVKELKETGIRDSILYIAIQKSAMMHYNGKPIGITQIKHILQGIDSLKEYLFPESQE